MGRFENTIAIIILAAGKGTRMKSEKAKVLHELLGKPMIQYVIRSARSVVDDLIYLVIGHQADQVRQLTQATGPVHYVHQEEQLGTGHAVDCVIPHLAPSVEHLLILCGDVPLISPATLIGLIDDHLNASRELTVLAVEVDQPTGYGRILLDEKQQLFGIVEEADATSSQKAIRLINTGIYCVERRFLTEGLRHISPDNAQKEYYLTDIVQIGFDQGRRMGTMVGQNAGEISGINTLADLAAVETLLAARKSKTT